LEEKEFSDDLFFNVYDPYIRSKYKTVYDVQTTPQIFILNRNHEILMKRIGAEQLGEVMEQVMKLLGLDSSLDNRKELATELGYTGAKDGSAEMNIWLHKEVMRQLAANGGTVPADLTD